MEFLWHFFQLMVDVAFIEFFFKSLYFNSVNFKLGDDGVIIVFYSSLEKLNWINVFGCSSFFENLTIKKTDLCSLIVCYIRMLYFLCCTATVCILKMNWTKITKSIFLLLFDIYLCFSQWFLVILYFSISVISVIQTL